MIRFKTGDMLAEDVDAMVNTVNCVGVMGRGVALQFKRAFPRGTSINIRSFRSVEAEEPIRSGGAVWQDSADTARSGALGVGFCILKRATSADRSS